MTRLRSSTFRKRLHFCNNIYLYFCLTFTDLMHTMYMFEFNFRTICTDTLTFHLQPNSSSTNFLSSQIIQVAKIFTHHLAKKLMKRSSLSQPYCSLAFARQVKENVSSIFAAYELSGSLFSFLMSPGHYVSRFPQCIAKL